MSFCMHIMWGEAERVGNVGSSHMFSEPRQASTKVYRTNQGLPAIQRLRASIRKGGLLVLAPDPLVPFATSILGLEALKGT